MRGVRVSRKVLWSALLLLLPLLWGLGCGGVKHLAPSIGRNYQAVFKRQRSAAVDPEQGMQGEMAEFAVENLRKSSTISDSNQGPAIQLIPLRR